MRNKKLLRCISLRNGNEKQAAKYITVVKSMLILNGLLMF